MHTIERLSRTALQINNYVGDLPECSYGYTRSTARGFCHRIFAHVPSVESMDRIRLNTEKRDHVP